MAIRDHVTKVAKLRAKIVTVEPSQRLIEAVTAEGGTPRRLSITDIDLGFQWPKEGEEWSIYEENGYWRLGKKFLNTDEDAAFTSMDPGTSIAPEQAETLDGGVALNVYGTPLPGYLPQFSGTRSEWAAPAAATSVTQEGWHLVGSGGSEPAFGSGWSNFASGNPEASFKKDPAGTVRLRGMLKRVSGSQTTLFVLPPDYRPLVIHRQVVPQHDGTAESTLRITVGTDGAVQLTGNVTANSATTWIFIDGVEFSTDAINFPVGAVQPIPFVTSLPSSPINGQEIYYQADSSNGILWHLRYNSLSVSSYKWEFLGGSDVEQEVAATESTTSITYADLTTVGPDLILPFAGIYDVTITVEGSQDSGQYWIMSFAIGANAANDATRVLGFTQLADPTKTSRVTIPSSNTLVRAKYRTSGAGTGTFSRRRIRARPVRIG